MESQSANSGNRFAAIEPIAGISLLLQFKQIRSCMPISAISQEWDPWPLQSTELVFSRKCRTLSAMDMNGLSAISSLDGEPMAMDKPNSLA